MILNNKDIKIINHKVNGWLFQIHLNYLVWVKLALVPLRNINLNNYPQPKMPSQELRIPGESLHHQNEAHTHTHTRHTKKGKKDIHILPITTPPSPGSLVPREKEIHPKRNRKWSES